MTQLQSLPLFPLDLVLYPGEQLPLHIFEMRYKLLAQRCLEHDEPFGIVWFDDEEEVMAPVGCTARIRRVLQRYDDGEMDILVVGQRRVRLLDTYEVEPYLTTDAELIEEPEEALDRAERERVITQHMKLLELVGHTVRPSLYQNQPHLSYVLAQNGGLQTHQKQHVLETLTENERITYLIRHFEELIPHIKQQETLRRKIRSNGYFKDFPDSEE